MLGCPLLGRLSTHLNVPKPLLLKRCSHFLSTSKNKQFPVTYPLIQVKTLSSGLQRVPLKRLFHAAKRLNKISNKRKLTANNATKKYDKTKQLYTKRNKLN